MPSAARSTTRPSASDATGSEGRFIAKRFLGNRARQEPWESLHEIFNGHPDENMPALREVDPKIIADILAYAQNLQEQSLRTPGTYLIRRCTNTRT